MHRSALILTFGGGTNEVQRDIIGMVGLGCPGPPLARRTAVDFTAPTKPAETLGAWPRSILDRPGARPSGCREAEAAGDRFDRELWAELAEAGVLAAALPESAGRRRVRAARAVLGPGRARPRRGAGALPGVDRARRRRAGRVRLRRAAAPVGGARGRGELILTAALARRTATTRRSRAASAPTTRRGGWRLTGTKTAVPAGPLADAARWCRPRRPAGAAVFLVDRRTTPGVHRRPRSSVTGGSSAGQLDAGAASGVGADRVLGARGGRGHRRLAGRARPPSGCARSSSACSSGRWS